MITPLSGRTEGSKMATQTTSKRTGQPVGERLGGMSGMSRLDRLSGGQARTGVRQTHAAAAAVAAMVSLNFSQVPTDELLANYWEFIKLPMSDAGAILVSKVGADTVGEFVKGDLAQAVSFAGGLQKARGRNISPEEVTEDLGIVIPAGYTPTFDVYLMAAGIRPDAGADRKIVTQIRAAIRQKIKEVRAGPDES